MKLYSIKYIDGIIIKIKLGYYIILLTYYLINWIK